MSMLLIVGLGNPGAGFAGNRHNIGFMVVDSIVQRHSIGPWRQAFQGLAAKGRLGAVPTVLLRPETFMNESGRAVAHAAKFYDLGPSDVVVFHDEIELPPGKVRVKTGGGNAGHNGLRSISSHIGNEYRRVRIGVGHPGAKELVHNHVLSNFAKSDREWVEALRVVIADNAALLANGEDATFQNKIHLAMQAKGFFDPKKPGESDD
jgi:PTH1 family peptidyl-tRNA hydrolase